MNQAQQPATIDDPQVLQHLDELLRSSVQDLVADAFDLGASIAWIIRAAKGPNAFTLRSSDENIIATNHAPTALVILFPYPITGDEAVEVIVPEREIVSQKNRSARSQPDSRH